MSGRYEKQAVYHELTLSGMLLCALLGLVFEEVLFLLLRIRVLEVPVPVLGFLWLLSGILVSGVMNLAVAFRERIVEYGVAGECFLW